ADQPNPISATITVTNSTISGNTANKGGGIYNDGTLSLSHSTINGNTATEGGGIYNDGNFSFGYHSPDELSYGISTVINSTITDNNASAGGGIYNNGILSVSYSIISDNYAREYGGGIYNSSSGGIGHNQYYNTENKLGIVTVSYTSITGNTAGTGGGGIYNNADDGGDYTGTVTYNQVGHVTVNYSRLSNNQAHFGGGIYNNGILSVGNSTIRHNRAFGIELISGAKESGEGGGIYNYNYSADYITATLDYSIIACNFDTPLEDSTKFIKIDNLVGKFINIGSLTRV
ncbi:hypothetical protein, partial [Nostoc sp.]